MFEAWLKENWKRKHLKWFLTGSLKVVGDCQTYSKIFDSWTRMEIYSSKKNGADKKYKTFEQSMILSARPTVCQ